MLTEWTPDGVPNFQDIDPVSLTQAPCQRHPDDTLGIQHGDFGVAACGLRNATPARFRRTKKPFLRLTFVSHPPQAV